MEGPLDLRDFQGTRAKTLLRKHRKPEVTSFTNSPKMSLSQKRVFITDALNHYKESIRIIPNYISSLNNIGMVYYSFYSKPQEWRKIQLNGMAMDNSWDAAAQKYTKLYQEIVALRDWLG